METNKVEQGKNEGQAVRPDFSKLHVTGWHG